MEKFATPYDRVGRGADFGWIADRREARRGLGISSQADESICESLSSGPIRGARSGRRAPPYADQSSPITEFHLHDPDSRRSDLTHPNGACSWVFVGSLLDTLAICGSSAVRARARLRDLRPRRRLSASGILFAAPMYRKTSAAPTPIRCTVLTFMNDATGT